MRLLTSLLLLIVCLALSGCSGQSELLLGKWENSDSKTTYEFRPDGMYEFRGPGPGVVESFGPYRVAENRLILTIRMPSIGGEWQDETDVYEFHVERDVLTLDGVKYTRAKK